MRLDGFFICLLAICVVSMNYLFILFAHYSSDIHVLNWIHSQLPPGISGSKWGSNTPSPHEATISLFALNVLSYLMYFLSFLIQKASWFLKVILLKSHSFKYWIKWKIQCNVNETIPQEAWRSTVPPLCNPCMFC